MEPPETLRVVLSRARDAGVDFDDAWEPAVGDALPPSDGRRLWGEAFEATREQWKRAYEGHDLSGFGSILP